MAKLIKEVNMYKTRKLFFTTFAAVAFAAILISLLLTCVPFGPPDDYDDEDYVYTDVEYSPDGSLVTIYLDGSAPVRQNRALTKSLAILGHDLFEVAFAYKNNSGQVAVARSVWETGHAAGISGVYREGAGVDYSLVRNVSSMGSDTGSAILFVGKKSDRTLLAVGRLAQVDGVGDRYGNPTVNPPVAPTPIPNITKNTRTVTFEVAALKAGVNLTPTSSSFWTDSEVATPTNYDNISPGNTKVLNVLIGQKPFPLFRLPYTTGRYMHGVYKFNVVTNTSGRNDFNRYYVDGIIQKTPVAAITGGDTVVRYPTATVATVDYNRIPRYPVGDNKWNTVLDSSIIEYAGVDQNNPQPHTSTTAGTRVRVSTSSIAAAGTPFNNGQNNPDNPVNPNNDNNEGLRFEIGPVPTETNTNGLVFAFSFEVPVYPLTNLDSRGDGFSWYLRPGYDSYRDDLDDGIGGTGGAILIGTGDFDSTTNNSIYLYRPPSKTKYNGRGTDPWKFSLDDIDIWRLQGASATPVFLSDCFFVIKNARLTPGGPIIGDIALKPNASDIQTILANNNADGKVTITIEYYGPPVNMNGTDPFIETSPSNLNYLVRNTIGAGGYTGEATTYITEFFIYYFDLPSNINLNIPDNQRFAITNREDFTRVEHIMTTMNAGGTILLALFHNYDLNTITLRAGVQFTVVIVAGTPDIIIGKSGTTAIDNNNQNHTYLIGVWPFDEILAVQGKAIESQPFYINTGGSYQQALDPAGNPTTPTQPPVGYFISGTGNKNIIRSGVTVFNLGNLTSPP